MNQADRADAAARALDLLPTDDPARNDPRLLRDKALLDEARAARETAADVWLAVSPLHAAPPEVLHAVMEKIGDPAASASVKRSLLAPCLAASGWAAAAAIAFFLGPRRAEDPDTSVVAASGSPSGKASQREPSNNTSAPVAGDAGTRRREELAALRDRVARLRDEDRGVNASRVMSLSAPGATRRTPEETRARVWATLTKALRSALEVESGAPNDPATLVIERGWLPEGMASAVDGTLLRHRNFPEDSWPELGLLRSDEGDYYDPARQLLWTRDPAGGGFMGTKAPEDSFDIAAFKDPETIKEEALAAPSDQDEKEKPKLPRAEPEGFLIEDPVTQQAELVIEQVPEPAVGNIQVLEWTDASGQTASVGLGTLTGSSSAGGTGIQLSSMGGTRFVLTPGVPPGYTVEFSPQPTSTWSHLLANQSSAGTGTYSLSTSFSNVVGFSSFQLVERPVVPDGTPDRVIVEGGE